MRFYVHAQLCSVRGQRVYQKGYLVNETFDCLTKLRDMDHHRVKFAKNNLYLIKVIFGPKNADGVIFCFKTAEFRETRDMTTLLAHRG